MQTSASGAASPSNVPSVPASVPSAANSIPSAQLSTSTVGVTITVSNAGDTKTQAVASTANVVKESSVIVPVPQDSAQSSATGVESTGTASHNMNVPSVGTANAVAPSTSPSAPSDQASPSASLNQASAPAPSDQASPSAQKGNTGDRHNPDRRDSHRVSIVRYHCGAVSSSYDGLSLPNVFAPGSYLSCASSFG
ncbi:unnamed protein product [Aureobasidium mustum]|uniref:Uncharacterized protein n=1 Tax=Aureobasidium mustum TaxID=2773714 RepID=A0A9N8PB24_9PEZI|nr:unnamed protein product [Aureobasidium mustum]